VITVIQVNSQRVIALLLVTSLFFVSPVALAQSGGNGPQVTPTGNNTWAINTTNVNKSLENNTNNSADNTWAINTTKVNESIENNTSDLTSGQPSESGTSGSSSSTSNNSSDLVNGSYTYSPIPGYTIDFGKIITTVNRFFIDQFDRGIIELINKFNTFMLTLPAPGEPTEPQTWITNNDTWWSAAYSTYGIMSALAIALLLPPLMFTTDRVDGHDRAEGFWMITKAFAAVVIGIPMVAFFLHLGNSVAIAIAPSGLDFVSSTGGLSTLGLGLILGTILILVKGTLVLAGVIMVMIQDVLIYLTVAFWPLFWVFRIQPSDTLRSFGNTGIAAFFLLILLKFIQVSILRFLFQLTTDLNFQEIYLLIVTSVGLLIAFIGVPYVFLKKLLPTSSMLMARKGSRELRRRRRGDRATDPFKYILLDIHQRVAGDASEEDDENEQRDSA
jgi:hypothetical protein